MSDVQPLRLGPGLHLDVPASDYHADPCETPSLSSHIAAILVRRSPAHAKLACPRLGGGFNGGTTDEMRAGSIIHDILLGGGVEIIEVKANDWRTNAAKAEREAIEATGKIAMLSHKLAAVREMAERIKQALPFDFSKATTEATAIWESDGIMCRCRIDALFDGLRIVDMKTTEDAMRAARAASIIQFGYHIQAAANIEAIETIFPDRAGRVSFLDAFAETEPPHGCLNVEIAGSMLDLGRQQWKRAKRLWAECLKTGQWPCYTTDTVRVEAPAWAMTDELGVALQSQNEPF